MTKEERDLLCVIASFLLALHKEVPDEVAEKLREAMSDVIWQDE